MGEMGSNGHRIYGYDYVRKTATAPAALVVNEEQAPVVRSIFEPGFPGWVECLMTCSPDFANAVSGLARRMGRDRGARDG
jgi:hypothetical protein